MIKEITITKVKEKNGWLVKNLNKNNDEQNS